MGLLGDICRKQAEEAKGEERQRLWNEAIAAFRVAAAATGKPGLRARRLFALGDMLIAQACEMSRGEETWRQELNEGIATLRKAVEEADASDRDTLQQALDAALKQREKLE